jgi:hypothetical protein
VAGQGYLLGMPEDEIRAETLDLDALLEAHAARLRSLGGFLDFWSADDAEPITSDPAPAAPMLTPPSTSEVEPDASAVAAAAAPGGGSARARRRKTAGGST